MISQFELYRLIEEAGARGERVVVATVAHTRGSTPQRRGAKMIFFETSDGGHGRRGCIEAAVGTIGASCARARSLHKFTSVGRGERRGWSAADDGDFSSTSG